MSLLKKLFSLPSNLIFFHPVQTTSGPSQILHLTQYFCIGGLEQLVLNLAREINHEPSNRFQASIAFYDSLSIEFNTQSLVAQAETYGIKVHTLSKGPRGISWFLLFNLGKLILSQKISILHTHDLGPLVYGAILKTFLGPRFHLVHTQHSMAPIFKKSKYRIYVKFGLLLADRCIAVSSDIREGLKQLGIKKSIEIINNGVYFSVEMPTPQWKQFYRSQWIQNLPSSPQGWPAKVLSENVDKIWFIYLARLERGKGQDHFAKLWIQQPEPFRKRAILLFMGSEGDLHYLNELKSICEGHLNQTVFFLGPTLNSREWLLACDYFVSLSEYEGHSLAALEAIAAGCALLLSDIPGYQTFREYGYLLQFSFSQSQHPVNRNGIKWNEILQYPPLIRYSEALWMSAKEKWSSSSTTHHYLQTYSELIMKRNK